MMQPEIPSYVAGGAIGGGEAACPRGFPPGFSANSR